MIREKIINTPPITGINPFDELPIDAVIWQKAHDNHHLHRLLHAGVCHRPGVVYGLEVLASGERKVIVAPGVAVDPEGRTIILQEPVTFEIDEKGEFFIVLIYKQPFIADSAVKVGGGEKYSEYLEGREVRAMKELPATCHLELARLYHTGPDKPLKNAANPFDPGSDEIDLLHRPLAFPHCYADVALGELAYVPVQGGGQRTWKPNRQGLWCLLQEGNGSGFHLTFAGPVNVAAEELPAPPALLYIAGQTGFQPLTEAQLAGLRRFLAGGGLLLGDSCGGDGFVNSFTELAGKLGATLQETPANHPVLRAHHIFAAPPPGGLEGGSLLLDDHAGVLLSQCNFGGAWQGDLSKATGANARERIRQAIEFGLNIVAYAAKRQRMKYLERIG